MHISETPARGKHRGWSPDLIIHVLKYSENEFCKCLGHSKNLCNQL